MTARAQNTAGRRLRRALYEPEVFALVEREGTWMAGGCWILAAALLLLFGEGAELRAVVSPAGPQHVVTLFGGLYWDADGAAREPALLRKMRRLERVPGPRLAALDADALRRGGVPEPDWRSERLAEMLKGRLGLEGVLADGR